MSRNKTSVEYPPIPDKIYFSISEASKLCLVEKHVLRYWEKIFPQLKPVKRDGNRRLYTCDNINLIRRINDLVHKEGYTLQGAKHYLSGSTAQDEKKRHHLLARQIRADLEDILRCLK